MQYFIKGSWKTFNTNSIFILYKSCLIPFFTITRYQFYPLREAFLKQEISTLYLRIVLLLVFYSVKIRKKHFVSVVSKLFWIRCDCWESYLNEPI